MLTILFCGLPFLLTYYYNVVLRKCFIVNLALLIQINYYYYYGLIVRHFQSLVQITMDHVWPCTSCTPTSPIWRTLVDWWCVQHRWVWKSHWTGGKFLEVGKSGLVINHDRIKHWLLTLQSMYTQQNINVTSLRDKSQGHLCNQWFCW